MSDQNSDSKLGTFFVELREGRSPLAMTPTGPEIIERGRNPVAMAPVFQPAPAQPVAPQTPAAPAPETIKK